jgi:hypothetical protein
MSWISTRDATILVQVSNFSDWMRPFLSICLVGICLLVHIVGANAQSTAQNSSPSAQSSSSTEKPAPVLPADQENARKAKALLEQAIQRLGGQAYLNVHDMQTTGRGYSFFHGRPTSNGVPFWRFVQYPDKERVEITKQRDIAQIYNGDKGWEITYKGPHPMDPKDVTDYLRRRRFSLETILRTWVNDPSVALFYEGNTVAAEHQALQVTLINAHNESVTIYLDADSHLPVKKSFRWRDPVDKQNNFEEEIYDDYRVSQGIMTPWNFTRIYNGDMASQRFLYSAGYNKGLDPAMFDPNSGYNPNKPAKR